MTCRGRWRVMALTVVPQRHELPNFGPVRKLLEHLLRDVGLYYLHAIEEGFV